MNIEVESSRGLDRLFRKHRHDISKFNFTRNTKFSNLSWEERATLKNLSKREDIIVQAADKGGALVVWQADLYQKKLCSNFLTPLFMLKSIKISFPLTNKLSRALLMTLQSNKNCRQLLPISSSPLLELHKPNNTCRPIVSTCSCPTHLISTGNKIMALNVRYLPTYVKDCQHALQIFRGFNFLGENKLIFTMGITSLYTVIPNGKGPLALKYFF